MIPKTGQCLQECFKAELDFMWLLSAFYCLPLGPWAPGAVQMWSSAQCHVCPCRLADMGFNTQVLYMNPGRCGGKMSVKFSSVEKHICDSKRKKQYSWLSEQTNEKEISPANQTSVWLLQREDHKWRRVCHLVAQQFGTKSRKFEKKYKWSEIRCFCLNHKLPHVPFS